VAMTVNCDGHGCKRVAEVRIRFHNRDKFVLPPGWIYRPTAAPADRRNDAVSVMAVCSEQCLRSLTDTNQLGTKRPPKKES
jgi:hypothetical protein